MKVRPDLEKVPCCTWAGWVVAPRLVRGGAGSVLAQVRWRLPPREEDLDGE